MPFLNRSYQDFRMLAALQAVATKPNVFEAFGESNPVGEIRVLGPCECRHPFQQLFLKALFGYQVAPLFPTHLPIYLQPVPIHTDFEGSSRIVKTY